MDTDYSFRTVWRVRAGVDEICAILGDAESLPRWWPSVYIDVREVNGNNAGRTGGAFDLYTKGWLPYTLRWRLTVTEPVTDSGFAIAATGDFLGTGRWTFEPMGDEVQITYDWRISAEKPLLNRFTWLLRPIFSANHEWAKRQGEASLRLELLRRRNPSATVSPPPGPTFARLIRKPSP